MSSFHLYKHPIAGLVPFKPKEPIRPGGPVMLDAEWVQKNFTEVFIAELVGVPTYGDTKCDGNITFYSRAAKQLQAAFAEIGRNSLANRILFFGGSVNFRFMRGSTRTLSNHCFGTAVDLNPQWNPYGSSPAPLGEKGSVVELVPYFKKYGFRWGGDFQSHTDGMHFEVERIVEVSSVEPSRKSVTLLKDGVHLDIPAFLDGGTTYVAVRPLLNHLDGFSILSVFDDQFVIEKDNVVYRIPGIIEDGVGYILLRDLMPILKNYTLTFSLVQGRPVVELKRIK